MYLIVVVHTSIRERQQHSDRERRWLSPGQAENCMKCNEKKTLADLCSCHIPNQTFTVPLIQIKFTIDLQSSSLSHIVLYEQIFLSIFSSEIAIINNFVNSQLWKALENGKATVVQADPCISHSVCSLDFLLLRLVSPWRLSGPIQPSADGL